MRTKVQLNLTHRERSGPIGKGLTHIGGHAMEAAASSGSALHDIEQARVLDRLGDLALRRADEHFCGVLTATTLADAKERASAGRLALAKAFEIDAQEGKHWAEAAPKHVVRSRDAGLSIVAFTERALTGGKPDAAA